MNDISTITNCYATGDVNGFGNQTGGLAGCNYGSSSVINNCYATGNVYSDGATSGGLVGRNDRASISNSYATGNVKSSGNWAGGLVGYNYENAGQITTSYATGDVFSEGQYTGGLVGQNYGGSIAACYASGNVYGENNIVGGLIGLQNSSGECSDSYALGSVKGGASYVCSLVGSKGSSIVSNCASLVDNKIGITGDVLTLEEIQARYTNEAMGFTEENGWVIINGQQYLKGMVPAGVIENTSLQIGINSSDNSEIEFNMGFALDGINSLSGIGKYLDRDYLSIIDNMLETINAKQTKFGSIQNRLESVLDEIVISRDNLVSSRSTIKDADMAEVSSQYIQQQILQEASATLLATANQTPALALQLL